MAIGRPISLTPNIATKNISSVATADQTEFTVTGGYRINEIAVYRNGVRLAEGRDFTASDGDTVNLVTAASASDVIEFAVFDSFNVADAIIGAASSQTVNGDLNVTGNFYAGAFNPTALTVGVATVSSSFHVGSALTANAAGDVETIGIITASTFKGDGSGLTGIAVTENVRTDTLTVAGVSTFTGVSNFSAAVNVDATTDSTSTSTGALIVDGGVGIAKNVYIGAGLSVAGTLTYEDVTNVDSVGMVTAKSGVNVSGGELNVGLGFSVGNVGVATALGVDVKSNLTVGSGITMGSAGVATFSGTSDVHLTDNVRLNLGDSSDMGIYHDGTNPIILAGTNTLRVVADNIHFEAGDFGDEFLRCNHDGSVDIYYDNSVKFYTTNDGTVTAGISTATGVDVTSNFTVGSGITFGSAGVSTFSGTADVHLLDNVRLNIGDASDLTLYHDGTNNNIKSTNGHVNLFLPDSKSFSVGNSDFSEDMFRVTESGAVTLYHNGNSKLATSATGVTITGNATATKFLGDGSALTGVGGDMDITSSLFV